MNLGVEAYSGELKNLRNFRDDILGAVELPEDVDGAIEEMDATDMTKACIRQALQSIYALKKATQARTG